MKTVSSLRNRLLAAPHIVWSVIFVVVPLIMVIYYAFTDAAGSFTLANIQKLTQPLYLMIFVRSVCFSIIATFICLVIGYPLAYCIARCKPRSRNTLIMLIMLPMWMSVLLRTYSWMVILQDTGVINSALVALGLSRIKLIDTPAAVILGMVYNFLPYMILPIYSVLTKLDKSVIEAAEDLGCNRMNVLTRIVLPLSTSGIISGITMVFVPCISTFYISQKLGGGNFNLIGDSIESQFMSSNDWNFGSALSLVLMVLIIICIAVMNRFTDEDERGEILV